jgi:hypothetical protein
MVVANEVAEFGALVIDSKNSRKNNFLHQWHGHLSF